MKGKTRTRSPLRKTPQQDRSRARVGQILDATRALLREQGLDAVTTTRIAERAGIPVGSVYQYFPDKKAVLLALYADYLDQVRGVLDGLDDAHSRALGWREYFLHALRKLKEEEQRDSPEPELLKAASIYPELHDIDRRHGQMIVDHFATELRRRGAVASPAKLQRLGWFVYALNNGVWHHQMAAESAQARAESVEWELRALLAVIGTLFPDDAGPR